MPLTIVAWILIFAVPQPVVNWLSDAHDAISVNAEGREELLDRCLNSGIEVRYRYEVKYCTKGSFWFDDCEDEFVYIKSIQFDPLKEIYIVKGDLLDDEDEPVKNRFNLQSDAVREVTTLERVSIGQLARKRVERSSKRDYVGIRILSECRGSVGSTLLDISYFLTFGLVKVSRFDSGWVAFYINR